jgi:hypothetical protein
MDVVIQPLKNRALTRCPLTVTVDAEGPSHGGVADQIALDAYFALGMYFCGEFSLRGTSTHAQLRSIDFTILLIIYHLSFCALSFPFIIHFVSNSLLSSSFVYFEDLPEACKAAGVLSGCCPNCQVQRENFDAVLNCNPFCVGGVDDKQFPARTVKWTMQKV